MKKSKNDSIIKKRIKYIVFIAIFCIFGLIMIINILNKSLYMQLKNIYSKENNNEVKIMPDNIIALDYQGNLDYIVLYKSMYNFFDGSVNKYYKLTKNFDDKNIQEYFEKKSKNIEREIGVTDKQEFIELIKNIQKLEGKKLEIQEYVIVPDTVSSNRNYLRLSIKATYKDNKPIGFNLTIYNNPDTTKTPIKYETCKDYKVLLYEKEELDLTPITDIIDVPGKNYDYLEKELKVNK